MTIKMDHFQDLIDQVNTLPIDEDRIYSARMREFVIKSNYVMSLHVMLQNFFGDQFKAPGEVPSHMDKKHAAFLGGVREEQTLYYHEDDHSQYCVMLWPWWDGRRYTVKMMKT